MHSIVILGAGNIGSRHLQGLSDLKSSADIHIIDPQEKSRSLSKKRWNAVDCDIHNISYHKSIKSVDVDGVSVGIIATPASVRKHVFEDFISHCNVESVIFEKFLFQSEEDYFEVQTLLENNDIDAWVNCLRRDYDLYQDIKKSLSGERIEMSVTGTQWGMGCNAIHYADLFGWLTESKKLHWDNHLLEQRLLEAKRDGFVEFVGSLIANDTDGNSLTLTCFEGQPSYATVRISTPSQQWIIDPSMEEMTHIMNRQTEWVSERTDVEIPYVSEMTGEIVTKIIQDNECNLPTYTESKGYHLPLLRTLIHHIEKVQHEEIEKCPIT